MIWFKKSLSLNLRVIEFYVGAYSSGDTSCHCLKMCCVINVMMLQMIVLFEFHWRHIFLQLFNSINLVSFDIIVSFVPSDCLLIILTEKI
jgi:hypothetical protein